MELTKLSFVIQLKVEENMQPHKQKSPDTPFYRFITPDIIGSFLIGGVNCEVLRVHGPIERQISTKILLQRGAESNADMRREDGDLLLRHRDEIPPEYYQNIFVFPLWETNKNGKVDGYIRAMERKGVAWWCPMIYPDVHDWDSSCRLVRFSETPLA